MQNAQATTPVSAPAAHKQAHEMHLSEFMGAAQVVALTNHGRKWRVTLGEDHCFSDAADSQAALRDAHHAAVNNALYLNQADAPDTPNKPSIPSPQVVCTYPDLEELYADVLKTGMREPSIPLPKVSKVEFDALIASLRLLSAGMSGGLVRADDGDIGDILTDSGTHDGLSADEVDSLCERILFM